LTAYFFITPQLPRLELIRWSESYCAKLWR